MTWKTTENAFRGEERSAVTGKGLTEADVRMIRALPYSYKAIGAQFNISGAMVCHIKKRRKWAHVKDIS